MVIRTVKDVIKPIFEPLIRRVVKEEMQLVQQRILTSMNQHSGNEIPHSETRSLQLRILNKLSLPVLTGRPIRGEDSTSVEIALVDVLTGEVVKVGPEASAKVEIVALQVDPDRDEGHDWTPEEFNLRIARERNGNKSLLIGNPFLNLREGIASVGEISFTHRSSWMKRGQFRLGARIVDNFNGTRVGEAKSEPFILEDRRSKLYEKHHPPSLSDEVWRLKNIGKGGPLVKRLNKENIKTVRDFLTRFFINRQGLRDILGNGMSDKMLNSTVEHGLTCKLDDRYLYYLPGSYPKTGIVFNVVWQVVGRLSEDHYVPIDNLPETEKADAQRSVASAFEHPGEVVPYYENSLLPSSSHLANALSPSNSPWLESPSGSNVRASNAIAGNDHLQPSTSSLEIIPPNISPRRINSIDDWDIIIHDVQFQDDPVQFQDDPVQFQDDPSGSPGQVPSHQVFDPMSMLKDFDEWFPDNFQTGNPNVETHADQTGNSIVAADKTQSRRWLKMSIVLRFSLRKRTEGSDHVTKRHRFH